MRERDDNDDKEEDLGDVSSDVSDAEGARVVLTALVKREKPKLRGVMGSSCKYCGRTPNSAWLRRFGSRFPITVALLSLAFLN